MAAENGEKKRDMLEDHKRTGAYYNACLQNRRQFAGKVVLDVGTGSGILAIFAAKAGARKVYAVEATSMAQHAKQLVTAQGLDGVVEVIQGTIESVELPEKVDVIISEWMGYFLLRESMLDSVLVARDRFLAPGGALYPSHARLFLAPIRSGSCHQRMAEFQNMMEGWGEFLDDMRRYYGVDMDCLSEPFRQEQREYYSQTASWTDIHPSQMLGPGACFKKYDLRTVTLEELQAPLKASITLDITEDGHVEALCGYFDTQFKGSPENPADCDVTLSTAPDPTGATHWGQQSFFLHPPVEVRSGDSLACEIEVVRRRDNHRLMEVTIKHKVVGKSGSERTSRFKIE
ncbi:hypothetical protein N2152v2_003237 [Parachlorella kessleri]